MTTTSLINRAGTDAQSEGVPDAGFADLTFLTTDIVGSSELHRRHAGEMLTAMDVHDDILHGAIRKHGGDPFKHTGDGVLAVFDSPVDAVRAVVEAQQALRQAAWGETGRLRLRCGVHTGAARPRGGDYFGPALSAVHRLEGAANADQILISDASVMRIGTDIHDAPFGFLSLGEHHFKGIDRISVYQVQADGLPDQFAPITGKRETTHGNLPAALNSFLGRSQEITLLRRMVDVSRIVTIVGPGGIGKTRTALELVRSLQPSFSGGAWLLNLASVERESELWPVIASMLEIDPIPGADRRQQVLDRLRDDKTVLLIDNCEHLLEQVADIVTDLAAACRSLSIVATSRQMLGVTGEAQFKLPALEPEADTAPEDATAVRLFVERARLVRHDFDPDAQDLATVQTICQSLDYLPLAIEIAAGQLRRHALERIASDAQNPLDLRPGKAQRRSSRQQTLRRTLEWSYDLIDPTSREVLKRLSVFSSPFHEEQALEVCMADMDDEVDVLDAMDELIDASLMTARVDGERRMRMLRAVQAFGREKLEDAGLTRAVEDTHAEVMVARCKALGQQFVTNEERQAAAAIQDDMPNIRVALERALGRDLELAARLTWPLLMYTYLHRESETASWPTRIMSQPGADDLADAPIMLAGCAAYAFYELGDAEMARAYVERGFALEKAGRNTSQGWLPHIAGQVAFWMREPDQFRTYHQQAVSEARAANDVACQVFDLSMAAFVEARMKGADRARDLMAQLDAMAPTLRQPTMIGYVHFARGGVATLDSFDTAVDELRQAIEWAEIGGNHLGAQRTNRVLADVRAIMAEPTDALNIQIKALLDLPDHGATIYNWTAISRLLAPLAKLKAYEEIAVISGALQNAPLNLGGSARGYIATARGRLGAEAFDEAAARGVAFDQAEARAYAIEVVGAHARKP